MRPLMLVGLAIATAGLLELVLAHLVLVGGQEFAQAGSIKVTSRTDRFFPILTLVGVFAVLGGAAMIYLARVPRRSR